MNAFMWLGNPSWVAVMCEREDAKKKKKRGRAEENYVRCCDRPFSPSVAICRSSVISSLRLGLQEDNSLLLSAIEYGIDHHKT